MKKLMLIAIVLMVTASLAFGGGQTPGTASTGAAVNPPGTLPIVDETVTLTAFVSQTGATDDYVNNDFTKWLEEKTNVHIDWNVASAADYATKRNLIIASREFPDIFINANWKLPELVTLGQDGVLMPLNDLIDEYGVNSKMIYDRFPRLRRILTAADGNIYGMPAITGAYHAISQTKLWVYQPWVEALGIEEPETTEEFFDMLMAFKEQDPNGNGEMDEIPLAGAAAGWMANVHIYLMNSFIYSDGGRNLLAPNGKIRASYNQPEWKDGLKYIKRLYDAGLIARESFTQTADQLKQLGENPDVPILGASPGGFQGVFSQVNGPSGRWLEFRTIPPMKGPGGFRTSAFIADMGLTDRIAELCLSSTCSNPAVAFRLGDFMYEDEADMFSDNGIEGVHWEWITEKGVIATDGTATATWRKLENMPKNTSWGNRTPRYNYFPEVHSKREATTAPLERILYEDTKEDYMPFVPPAEQIIPELAFSIEDANFIAETQPLLTDYVLQMVARFVTGDVDIDAGWNDYLRELENIGLQEYLTVYQKTFDKFLATE